MSYSGILTTIAGLLAILCFLYLAALPKPIPGIPYDAEAVKSIWGNGQSLMKEVKTRNNFPRWLVEQIELSQSPLKQIFLAPFGKPMVLLADYREARDIMVHRAKDFDRAARVATIFGPIAPSTQFILKTGPEWKRHRQLLQDTMTPSFLHKVAAPNIYGSGLRLIQLWDMKIRIAKSRPFSAADDIYHAAFDAVLAFTFGPKFPHSALAPTISALTIAHDYDVTDGLSIDDAVSFCQFGLDDELQAMLSLVEYLNKVQGHPTPGLMWQYYKNTPTFRQFMRTKSECIQRELEKSIDSRRNNDATGEVPQFRNAVDHVIDREHREAEKEQRRPNFFSQMIIDELYGLVIAGHDTTSSSLCWAVKLLADHPEVQQRLRKSLQRGLLDAHMQTRLPTAQEIMGTSIPYLDAVMEELFRVGNTSALGAREALHDTTVLGCRIPKGTTVIYPTIGRGILSPSFKVEESLRTSKCQQDQRDGRTSAWDDADIALFKPERWLKRKSAPDTKDTLIDGERTASEISWDDHDLVFDGNAGPVSTFGKGARGCFGRRLAYVEFRILLTLIIWNFELQKCPKELSGYQATLGLVYKAEQCFVRLRRVTELAQV